jgi:hypothetical protein
MHPEDGAECLQVGFLKDPHRSPDLPAAVLAVCLACFGYCPQALRHFKRTFDSNQMISLQAQRKD